MNLLTDPLIAVSNGEQKSLPGLFSAMVRGEVQGFPAMRPHQRPAWQMFLVQLAALAAWKAGWADLPGYCQLNFSKLARSCICFDQAAVT